jgi:hypothetical protein
MLSPKEQTNIVSPLKLLNDPHPANSIQPEEVGGREVGDLPPSSESILFPSVNDHGRRHSHPHHEESQQKLLRKRNYEEAISSNSTEELDMSTRMLSISAGAYDLDAAAVVGRRPSIMVPAVPIFSFYNADPASSNTGNVGVVTELSEWFTPEDCSAVTGRRYSCNAFGTLSGKTTASSIGSSADLPIREIGIEDSKDLLRLPPLRRPSVLSTTSEVSSMSPPTPRLAIDLFNSSARHAKLRRTNDDNVDQGGGKSSRGFSDEATAYLSRSVNVLRRKLVASQVELSLLTSPTLASELPVFIQRAMTVFKDCNGGRQDELHSDSTISQSQIGTASCGTQQRVISLSPQHLKVAEANIPQRAIVRSNACSSTRPYSFTYVNICRLMRLKCNHTGNHKSQIGFSFIHAFFSTPII